MNGRREHGEVCKWSKDRGWGFLTADTAAQGEPDLFVHVSEVESGVLVEGLRVTFERGEHLGRRCARRVAVEVEGGR